MNARIFFAGLAVCLGACVSYATAAPSNTSTSVSIEDDHGTATLRGDGVVNILGDKLESKNGTVSINGASFGAVPAGSEVKYVVTKTSRVLYVDGKPRSAMAKK